MRTYIKKGRFTPKAIAARKRGAQANAERKFLHDRTSAYVDKEVKQRAVEIFGNVNAALVFAIDYWNDKIQGEQNEQK